MPRAKMPLTQMGRWRRSRCRPRFDGTDGGRVLESRLLVVLLGVIILSTRGGPSSASAAILHSSAGDDEAGEIIAARTPVIREVDDAMAVEAGVIGRLDFQPDKIQIPLMQLKINPFRRASAATTPRRPTG